mmetsp:Transcript_4897/g.8869  ORF Transcript_4897/g.8869 Transcript_4897/m.8869 type:complete len:91 (-) Transcript_4897:1660-1932(-)
MFHSSCQSNLQMQQLNLQCCQIVYNCLVPPRKETRFVKRCAVQPVFGIDGSLGILDKELHQLQPTLASSLHQRRFSVMVTHVHVCVCMLD